jgi:hypothetical protein
MFHLGDIVEEIATNRQGKIDNISQNNDANGRVTSINYWRVIFTDGKQPLYQIVKEPTEIRVVSCPHSDPEPGFYPDRPITG